MSDETLVRRLAERVKLLNDVIVEHHEASVMREGVYVCPVCVKYGAPGFFYETSALLRDAEVSA